MSTATVTKQAVLIYGTLKRGGRLHRHLQTIGAEYVRDVATVPRYMLLSNGGAYPCLVRGKLSVKGELWLVDAEGLRHLDFVEGVAFGLYKRATVSLDDPEQVQALAYLWNRSTEGLDDCGDFWPVANDG